MKLREETVAAQKRVLPPDHPDTLGSMHNLAMSYDNLNRHQDALKLLEETLAARKRVLSPDHPDTLTSQYNLATSYEKLNRYTDALKLREETLAARKRVLPPDHPDTLLSMCIVAETLFKLDRPAEALRYIDECLALAAGQTIVPYAAMWGLRLRLRHFEKVKDAAGCRASAKLWEELKLADADNLYSAACYRAIAAGLYSKADQKGEAAADAEKAMEWLNKSIAAGFRDRVNMDVDTDLVALRGRADFEDHEADETDAQHHLQVEHVA